MWTEEKLKEAAREWSNNPDRNMEWQKGERYCSFLAGCKYIINNTQKDNEDKVRKEDMEAEG